MKCSRKQANELSSHLKTSLSLKLLIKVISWLLGVLIVILLALALITLKPVNNQPISNYPEVIRTQQFFDTLDIHNIEGDVLHAGWAAINITPEAPIDMAGYGPRGPYHSVLDSLYARIIVFDNKKIKAAIISVDLIMFPRLLRQRIEEEMSSLGINKEFLFLTATHTHHGFGNWEQSAAGEFAFGEFDQSNMDRMVNKIKYGINIADQSKTQARISFRRIDAGELVMNRLAPENGKKDPFLRLLQIQKDNGEKGMLISYSGHATNLDADEWELSRDYPGVLIKELEENGAADFAMFGAGMVGSHNIQIDLPKGHIKINETGRLLAEKIFKDSTTAQYDAHTIIGGIDAEIELPASQLRLTKNIAVRDLAFKSVFGPLKANIKALRIGNTLLIGMPCDYSGELAVNNQLEDYANQHGLNLFVTSFNGNYVGYITEDMHYKACNHDEVKTMNWVGPHMGRYFTDIIKRVIDAAV